MTICDEVAKLSNDIRNMLRESDKVKTYEVRVPGGDIITKTGKLNQTAAIDDKIASIKESPGEWHRTPKGKPVIYTTYTEAEQTLEPRARDVIEMAEHDRPYICHAIRMAGKNKVACFVPTGYFQFIKDNLESINESEKRLKEIIQKRWQGETKPQTDAEKALMESIESRRKELHSLLEPAPAETIYDEYKREMVVAKPAKPGLASYAVIKCSLDL